MFAPLRCSSGARRGGMASGGASLPHFSCGLLTIIRRADAPWDACASQCLVQVPRLLDCTYEPSLVLFVGTCSVLHGGVGACKMHTTGRHAHTSLAGGDGVELPLFFVLPCCPALPLPKCQRCELMWHASSPWLQREVDIPWLGLYLLGLQKCHFIFHQSPRTTETPPSVDLCADFIPTTISVLRAHPLSAAVSHT